MDGFESSTLSGIIGTLVGAGITKYLTSKSQKMQFTFEFHREFNSSELYSHRLAGDNLIKVHPLLDFNQLGKVDEARATSLYLVMNFYQRLWLAIKYKQINGAIAAEMFAQNFYFWYYISYKENLLNTGWSNCHHIRDLATWFYECIGLEKHNLFKDRYEKLLISRKSAAQLIEQEASAEAGKSSPTA